MTENDKCRKCKFEITLAPNAHYVHLSLTQGQRRALSLFLLWVYALQLIPYKDILKYVTIEMLLIFLFNMNHKYMFENVEVP